MKRIALKWRRDSCEVVDDNGKKCHKQAVKSVCVFLDPQISRGVYWLQGRVCKEHASAERKP